MLQDISIHCCALSGFLLSVVCILFKVYIYCNLHQFAFPKNEQVKKYFCPLVMEMLHLSLFTREGWWVASLLQLFAGFAWAYLIEGIVAVLAASQVNDALLRQRIDQARDLLRT